MTPTPKTDAAFREIERWPEVHPMVKLRQGELHARKLERECDGLKAHRDRLWYELEQANKERDELRIEVEQLKKHLTSQYD